MCSGYATALLNQWLFPAATLPCRVVDWLLPNLGFTLTIPNLLNAVITTDAWLCLSGGWSVAC